MQWKLGESSWVRFNFESACSRPSLLHRKKAVPMSVSTSLDVGLRILSLKTIIIAFYSGGFSLVLITYPHQ